MSRPYNTRFRITRRREGALSHLGESIKNLKTIGTSETDRERIESMIHQKNIESLILKARLHNDRHYSVKDAERDMEAA